MDHITPFHLKSETTMYVHARNMRRHKMCGVHLLRPENNRLNIFWIILMNQSILFFKYNHFWISLWNISERIACKFRLNIVECNTILSINEMYLCVVGNCSNQFSNYIISTSIFRWVCHFEINQYNFYIFFKFHS